MAKDEDRFVTVHKEGSGFSEEGVCMVIIDKWTGVNYLAWKSGYGAGLTPLLDPNGKPIVSPIQ